MEQEHPETEVPGGIVARQLTPTEMEVKEKIKKKLEWVSGKFVTNYIPAEEISDLVKDLVDNDEVVTSMLNEPEGKLIVELVTRCSIRFPKVRAWASLRGLMCMEGIHFIDIMPYLGILVRKNQKASTLLTGLIRVCLFYLLIGVISGQKAPETDFKVTKDFLLIKSALYNNKIWSFSESFDLLEFAKMDSFMNDLVEKSNSFLHFSQEHSKCSKIGLRPNLIDDVNEIIKIAKLQRLNNLVMTHVEVSGDAENQYVIM